MIVSAAEFRALERDALALVDEAQAYVHLDAVIARATRRPGRPRLLTCRALLVAIQIAALEGEFFINQLPKILNGLSPATQRDLGYCGHQVTWRQVQYLLTRINRALRPSIEDKSKHDDERYFDFDVIFSAIATAGSHDDAWTSTSVSIDGSDIDTWAKSQNKHKLIEERFEVVKKNTDSDAGYRGTRNEEYKRAFFGYELTVATAVADVSGPEVPKAAKAARFRPVAISDPRVAALSALGEVKDRQGLLGDVLVDRGYTSSNDGRGFLAPARALGANPVFDLRENQVGISGSVHGALIIDGRPYSPSLPRNLRTIKPPRSTGTNVYRPNPAEIADYEAKIADREKYALLPHGKQSADGKLVMQCPGAAGKLVCPLQASMVPLRPGAIAVNTQPRSILPNSVCASRYKTFDIATDLPLYQREIYGSTAWRKSYARRGTSVEPHFGALKDEAVAGFARGKVRMRGLIETGIMVAAALATTNLRFARAWDRRMQLAAESSKHERPRRKPYHHRLTLITRQVGSRTVVLHPLLT